MMKKCLVAFLGAVVLLCAGCGAKPDIDTLRTRAEQGDAKAQFLFGLRYYNGDGVSKCFVESYKWLLIADASAHKEESGASKKVAKAMTPGQIAEAQAQAQKWQQEFAQLHPAKP